MTNVYACIGKRGLGCAITHLYSMFLIVNLSRYSPHGFRWGLVNHVKSCVFFLFVFSILYAQDYSHDVLRSSVRFSTVTNGIRAMAMDLRSST